MDIQQQYMGLCSTKENLVNQPTKKGKGASQNKQNKTSFASAILIDKTEQSLFESQVLKRVSQKYVNNSFHLQLIFRASDSLFSAEKFHAASNEIGNTILIAKTLNGKVFGGFTPCTWHKDTMYKYEADEQLISFLFTFYKEKQEQQEQTANQEKKGQSKKASSRRTPKMECLIYKLTQKSKAIMNHDSNGPIFGEGHDIFITDKCNKNDNWCNIGKSYNCKYPFGSKKANESLTGESKFLIMDYELWQIKF